MLTINEIENFSDLLDKEYFEEIKPILIKTHNVIDNVLSLIQSDEYHEMRKRVGYDILKFEDLDCEVKNVLYKLRYAGHSYDCRDNIYGCETPSDLVGWLGFNHNCPLFADGRLMSVFKHSDTYKGSTNNMISAITRTKKEFDEIKYAYDKFFVENDGLLFKKFCKKVAYNYDMVSNADKRKDEELYSLFGKKNEPKKIKITVLIEGV